KEGTSRKYFQVENNHALLQLHFLDTVFKDISFTAYSSTREANHVDPAETFVLYGFTDSIDRNLKKSISNQLLASKRLFYLSLSDTEREIFVEFPNVKS